MVTNEELLEYLMTSDFVEDAEPEKLRDLLKSFRYFYRLQYGKSESLKHEIDKYKYETNVRSLKLLKTETELKNEQMKYNALSNRKLSFRERLFGKIIKVK